jgi:hypothetical protein
MNNVKAIHLFLKADVLATKKTLNHIVSVSGLFKSLNERQSGEMQ